MRVSASRFIPVMLVFAESEARADAWGRFLELQANRARLMTRVRLEKGDRMSLSFELPGEAFEGIAAEILRSDLDDDGYYVCVAHFPRKDDRVRLGRRLQRLLAAS